MLSDRLAVLLEALKLDGEIDVMGDLGRLYYDLAGISMPKQYALLRMVTDDSHLLYGTDSPFTPRFLCEQFLTDMEETFSLEQAKMVFRDNALSIFPELKGER